MITQRKRMAGSGGPEKNNKLACGDGGQRGHERDGGVVGAGRGSAGGEGAMLGGGGGGAQLLAVLERGGGEEEEEEEEGGGGGAYARGGGGGGEADHCGCTDACACAVDPKTRVPRSGHGRRDFWTDPRFDRVTPAEFAEAMRLLDHARTLAPPRGGDEGAMLRAMHAHLLRLTNIGVEYFLQRLPAADTVVLMWAFCNLYMISKDGAGALDSVTGALQHLLHLVADVPIVGGNEMPTCRRLGAGGVEPENGLARTCVGAVGANEAAWCALIRELFEEGLRLAGKKVACTVLSGNDAIKGVLGKAHLKTAHFEVIVVGGRRYVLTMHPKFVSRNTFSTAVCARLSCPPSRTAMSAAALAAWAALFADPLRSEVGKVALPAVDVCDGVREHPLARAAGIIAGPIGAGEKLDAAALAALKYAQGHGGRVAARMTLRIKEGGGEAARGLMTALACAGWEGVRSDGRTITIPTSQLKPLRVVALDGLLKGVPEVITGVHQGDAGAWGGGGGAPPPPPPPAPSPPPAQPLENRLRIQ